MNPANLSRSLRSPAKLLAASCRQGLQPWQRNLCVLQTRVPLPVVLQEAPWYPARSAASGSQGQASRIVSCLSNLTVAYLRQNYSHVAGINAQRIHHGQHLFRAPERLQGQCDMHSCM